MKYPGVFSNLIPPKNVSKYSLKMMKLRSKLFSEYIRPPMPYNISRAAVRSPIECQKWDSFHYQNEQLVMRIADLPCDLDLRRSIRYYPAHPQIKDLMNILRQHGLYRDEHMDIKEEMSRLRALRGKPDKGWGRKKNQQKEKSDDN